MGALDYAFGNDPAMDDSYEAKVHLYAAGIILLALGFLVAVRKGLGKNAM